MLLKQVIELFDILDTPKACGQIVKEYLLSVNKHADIDVYPLHGPKGKTDMVRIMIPGIHGKSKGMDAPTIGLLGRLGGLGARPQVTGFVSDGDGALAALAAAAKLLDMQIKGDFLEGDVIVSTHICPDAPTRLHEPVPFMDSPVEMSQVNAEEVSPKLDAILSVDTTKGNRIINHRGIAISNTVKEGYILPCSEDLLDVAERVTGSLPHVFSLSTLDITPYENGLYHLNSILQPCTATCAPTVGVAIVAESSVAGCATGATQFADVEMAARFLVEAAKDFGRNVCRFYNEKEYAEAVRRYGSMKHLQTAGSTEGEI